MMKGIRYSVTRILEMEREIIMLKLGRRPSCTIANEYLYKLRDSDAPTTSIVLMFRSTKSGVHGLAEKVRPNIFYRPYYRPLIGGVAGTRVAY
jgi:hypothetical protein